MSGSHPITLGRQKLIAAKLDLLSEVARQYAHGTATMQDLTCAALDYTRALEMPLAQRTIDDHRAKGKTG